MVRGDAGYGNEGILLELEDCSQSYLLRLKLVGASVHDGERLRDYTVLVTDVAYPIDAIGQIYRDRVDCENGFDELKNEWGPSGFITQNISRCQIMARAGALIYNW